VLCSSADAFSEEEPLGVVTITQTSSTPTTCHRDNDRVNGNADDGTITISIESNEESVNFTYQIMSLFPTGININQDHTTADLTHTFYNLPNAYYFVVAAIEGAYDPDELDEEFNIEGRDDIDRDDVTVGGPSKLTAKITPDPAAVCETSSLNLDGNPSGGNEGDYSHLWEEEGANYLDRTDVHDPVFDPSNGGSFFISYRVTDSKGCTTTTNTFITVDEQPVADAGEDDYRCFLPGEDKVYGLSAEPSVGEGTWSQSAGTGTSVFSNENDFNSQVTVSDFGTYTFTWTEVNGTCSDSDDVTIRFLEQPVATASAEHHEVCGETADLEGGASVGEGEWSYEGPGTVVFTPSDEDQEVTVTLDNPASEEYGLYTFTWTVSNEECTDTAIATVTFYEQPEANAGEGGEACCTAFDNLMASYSVIGSTGEWTVTGFPDGAEESHIEIVQPNDREPTVTLQNTGDGYIFGTYTLRWTETNGVCPEDYDEVDITFYEDFEITEVTSEAEDDEVCGLTVGIMASIDPDVGTGSWMYEEDGPGDVTIANEGDQQTTVEVSEPGEYTFTWHHVNGTCEQSDQVTVSFFAEPEAEAFAHEAEVCGRNAFLLANDPEHGSGSWTWTWIDGADGDTGIDFIDGTDAHETSVVVDHFGQYEFYWIVENGPCEPAVATASVTFLEQPEVTIISAGEPFCEDELPYVYTLEAEVDHATGEWTVDPPTGVDIHEINNPNTEVTFEEEGEYTFYLSADNGICPPVVASVTYSIYLQPEVEIIAGDPECGSKKLTSLQASPAGGRWYPSPGNSVSYEPDREDPEANVTVSDFGTYTFEWSVNNNGCIDEASITATFSEAPVADAGEDDETCLEQGETLEYFLQADYPVPGDESVGTGTWTYSGEGVLFKDKNDPRTRVTVPAYGEYTFTWVTGNGNCPLETDDVTIAFIEQPVANAGDDKYLVNEVSYVLEAVPSAGTGTWSADGPGTADFSDVNDPGATVTVNAFGTYTFTWAEDNNGCSDIDKVEITFDNDEPLANAGEGGDVCVVDLSADGFFNLAAIPSLTDSEGYWEWEGPAEPVFDNPDAPETRVTVSGLGAYTFTWTEYIPPCTGGDCEDSDQVVVHFVEQPVAEIISEDGHLCVEDLGHDSSYALEAGFSSGDTGLWEATTVPDGGSVFFDPGPDSPGTMATVTGTYGLYEFTWTESNRTCTSSSTVQLTAYEEPVADAGNGGHSNTNDFQLEGDFSVSGSSGLWEVTDQPEGGSAAFNPQDNPESVASLAAPAAYGSYEFTWTETNGQCSASDAVMVTFYEQPSAYAGEDDHINSLAYDLQAKLSVTGATGEWELVSGPEGGSPDFESSTHEPANTDPGATVTVNEYGEYTFRWTEINEEYSDSEEVTIAFFQQPVADAGPGGNSCNLDFDLEASYSLPGIADGLWTMDTGPGQPDFDDPEEPVTMVSVDTYGTYDFTWTEYNGPYQASETITVNFYEQPAANAGTGGVTNTLSFSLDAEFSVQTGSPEGVWEQVAGPGDVVEYHPAADDPGAIVTVDAYGDYQFSWTEINGTCSDVASIDIEFWEQPVANADPGTKTTTKTFVLQAYPSVENPEAEGYWVQTAGPEGVTFNGGGNPYRNPVVEVTVPEYDYYEFVWNEENGPFNDQDLVAMGVYEQPVADAGDGGEVCGPEFDLNAAYSVESATSTGTWTVTGAPEGAEATFDPDAQTATATVTVDIYGAYEFTWTEYNGPFSDDEPIEVVFWEQPVADAGPDSETCGQEYTLEAVPSVGSGTWTRTAGPGSASFDDAQDPESEVSVTEYGVYTFTWTEVNGSCPADADEVQVAFRPNPARNSITYSQPHPEENCIPITVRVLSSQDDILYGLNYEDWDGNTEVSIQEEIGDGSSFNFDQEARAGYYTVTAYNVYPSGLTCSTEQEGELIANELPDEPVITPRGEVCGKQHELVLETSQPDIEYRLYRDGDYTDRMIEGDSEGGEVSFGELDEPGYYRIRAKNPETDCVRLFDQTVTVNPDPVSFVLSPSTGCTGTDLILESSEEGIEYYLYLDPATGLKSLEEVAGPITGTGEAISFGPQYDEGIYEVVGVNTLTNCVVFMESRSELRKRPAEFAISPQDGGCAPIDIYMEHSQDGVTYTLYRDDEFPEQSIESTGGRIEFDTQLKSGIYTVRARVEHDNDWICTAEMTGSVEIYTEAEIFTLRQSSDCSPVEFYLGNSESGVEYTLWHETYGEKDVVTGTGSLITFAEQTEPGDYYVMASSGTGCQTRMDGTGTILPAPEVYQTDPAGGLFCANEELVIGMNDSDEGVVYQLRRAGYASNPVGVVTGTGDAFSFEGTHEVVGVYNVFAVNDNGCESRMDGSIEVTAAPERFSITADGTSYDEEVSLCPDREIGLDGAREGVQYTLHLPGGDVEEYEATDDNPFVFGTYSAAGPYYVTAHNEATGCSEQMKGEVNLYTTPEIFALSVVGDDPPIYCEGNDTAIDLGLSGSQQGVEYQLMRNGTEEAGPPQAGDGDPLTWHAVSQYGPGDYTVEAQFTADSECPPSEMDGQIEVVEVDSPTAEISGETTICYSQPDTWMDIHITGDQPVVVEYGNNHGDTFVTDPLDPANEVHSVDLFTDRDADFELLSVEYADFPGCNGTVSGSFSVTVDPLPLADAGDPLETCETSPVIVDQATAEHYTEISWSHDGFGDLTNETTLEPTYTPHSDDAGQEVVLTMVVTGEGTCDFEQATASTTITVDPLPVAELGDDFHWCVSRELYMEDLIINDDHWSSLEWDHNGEGTMAGHDRRDMVYTPSADDAGNTVTFTLTLYGDNTCDGEEVTRQVAVHIDPMPVADAGQGGTICVTDNFLLEGSADHASSVLWEIREGGSGRFVNPGRAETTFEPDPLDEPATIVLQLTAFGKEGCEGLTHTSTVEVEVWPLPVADAGPDIEACGGGAAYLEEAAVENAELVIWSTSGSGEFDDEFAVNPTYYPSQEDLFSGEVMLTLEVANDYCTSVTDQTIVSFRRMPFAAFQFDAPVCGSEPVEFRDYSFGREGYITKWIYDFGDGNTETIHWPDDPSVEHTFDYPGHSFDVSLTVIDNNGCEATTTRRVEVENTPVANFVYSNTCEGSPTRFYDQSQSDGNDAGAEIVSYFWEFDDPQSGVSNTSTATNPEHIFTSSGVYEVSLTVTNQNGCSNTMVKEVEITPAPDLAISVEPFCLGEPFTFSAEIDAAVESYFWDFGDGHTSDLPEPEHTYNQPGTYEVSLIVATEDGCEIHSDPLEVSVEPLPVARFTASADVCAGGLVEFTDLSTSENTSIVSHTWDFGDGNTSSEPNPEHIFDEPGVYTVHLEIEDDNGCFSMYTMPVRVYDSPVASFSYKGACDGQAVQFTDESVSGAEEDQIVSWEWDFDDPESGNNSSTNPNPVHIFSGPGEYQVSLEVTSSNGCTDEIIVPVQIESSPEVEISHQPACFGEPYAFFVENVGTTTEVVSYYWSFGDGRYSEEEAPEHTYDRPGTYEVTLEIVDARGCVGYSEPMEVVVSPDPHAAFEVPEALCLGEEAHFTDTSRPGSDDVGIVSWAWDFGDGNTSAVQHPSHVYAQEGIYNVVLTIETELGCQDTHEWQVEVFGVPEADFTWEGDCQGQNVAFEDLSFAGSDASQIVSWEWDFGDPQSGVYNSSEQKNPTHSFSGFGTYEVSLLVTNNHGCVDEITREVTIRPAPMPEIAMPEDDVCVGMAASFEFYFDDMDDMDQVESVSWDFGDGNSSNDFEPDHTYQTPGYYTVDLTVTFDDGCQVTVSEQIRVMDLPNAQFTMSDSYACPGQEITFTHFSSQPGEGEITSWRWEFEGGTISETFQSGDPVSMVYAFEDSGVHEVTLTVFNELGCSDSITRQVYVYSGPTADFSAEPSCEGEVVAFRDASDGGGQGSIIDWHWDFGDGNHSDHPNPMHTYSNAGTYSVTLTVTDTNGCSDEITAPVTVIEAPEINAGVLLDGEEDAVFADSVSICRGDTIRLYAKSENSETDGDFTWEGGLYQQGDRISPEETTTYEVEMMDDNGCIGYDSITIVVEDVPEIAIVGQGVLTCEDPELRLGTEVNAFGHEYTVTWSSEVMEDDFNGLFLYVDEPGIYQATAATRGGCKASDSVMVEQDLEVYIPNAFRPESDIRVNQTFMPLFYECEPENYRLRIFDRYGNEVFTTDDVNGNGWDGIIDGRRASPGAYTYQVEYDVGDGHRQKQGTVYLVR